MLPVTEHIPTGPQGSFAWRHFVVRNFPLVWHVHPEVELTWIVRGRGRRHVGDHVGEFVEGDLVLLGPNLPHTWHSQPERGKRSESVVIQFLPTCFGEGFLDRPEARGVKRLLAASDRGVFFAGKPVREIGRRMVAMGRLRPLARMTELLNILDELSRFRQTTPLSERAFSDPPRQTDQKRIDAALRHIDELIEEEDPHSLSQASVARALSMSPAAFSRLFKRSTGRTFMRYVHGLRVGKACRMLVETDEPITSICYAAGFNNLSNFNRVFLKLRGMSPREYRKSIAGN
jgi:AraC-like DNA-binding protein